jgi:hypothetical protein
MLPNEEDYYDHQGEDSWIADPFVPNRQKIRMFKDMVKISHRAGSLESLYSLRSLIKDQIKISSDNGGLLDRELLPGLLVVEKMVNDAISKLT